MDALIAAGVMLNLLITSILLWRLISARKSLHDIKVLYVTDISDSNGFMKKQKKVQVKAQLMIGEVPIGQPFIISEQVTETVDAQRVSEIVEHIAKPLVAIGIKVVTKGIA